MTPRPVAVAFDVIGTLMSLEPLRGRLTGLGQPPYLLEAWYSRTVRDGMALSAAGDFAAFPAVAESCLRALTGPSVSDEQVEHVMAGFSDLPAFPDAVPAVTDLFEAGIRIACLTNGPADLTASFVDRCGLGPMVERVISVGEVYRWKPAAVVYLYAAEILDVTPSLLAMVAAHDWDCHGAKRAGLATGWVDRGSGGFGAVFAPPDVTGESLTEVAGRLLALEPLRIGSPGGPPTMSQCWKPASMRAKYRAGRASRPVPRRDQDVAGPEIVAQHAGRASEVSGGEGGGALRLRRAPRPRRPPDRARLGRLGRR